MTGHSAGGFASLLAQAEVPDSIGKVIAFGPAFAGKRYHQNYQMQEADEFIKTIIANADGMNALVFSYENDPYNEPEDLSVWNKNEGIRMEPIHGHSIEGHDCDSSIKPHHLVFAECFHDKKRDSIC